MFTNFFHENFVLCGIMWENTVQTYRPQITRKYGACASYAGHETTNTHSECAVLIAFPLQNGYTNAPQYYVLLSIRFFFFFFFKKKAVTLYTGNLLER